MNDLISRQAAIQAVGAENWAGFRIGNLPSAQPEITEAQVKEYCEKRCLVVLSSDAFHRLKSAQPERKKGRWILSDEQRQEDVDNGNYQFICSECGKSDIHSKAVIVSFCWNCGADMREEKADE